MSKKVLMLLSVIAVMFTAPLAAQTPTSTPEGTVITNNASVSYTDANGNTYSNATATISVTVGFVGAIDVQGQATYTPASPSTNNQATFPIYNNGNGVDTVQVTTSTATGVTIVGYKIGATSYANLTALNAALATTQIARTTGHVDVIIVYNVASLNGGNTIPLSLTATSKRDGTKTDTYTSNISPPVAGSVAVSADSATESRLPSGAQPAYSTTFTVSNGANASRTFNLTGAVTGSGVTVASVNGGTATVTIAGNGSATITVTYTVGNVAAGTNGAVTLNATAQDDNTVTSTGTQNVTVIKANLALTKEVFRDNQTTPITASDLVLPGESIWYKLTITNNGSAAASGLTLTDQLPAAVTYNGNSAPGSWNVVNVAGTITATLTGTMAPLASNIIWVHVTVK